MAISDTISSIEDNIRADYEGLENIGADLTGINKNILNIRTILDTIYNDMPKVTGEGTEVTLSPTRKGRLALIPKGNSTQESTNGYNLVNYDGTQVTLIKSTARTINITPSNSPITLQAGTYTISLPDLVLANNSYSLRFQPLGTTSFGIDVDIVDKKVTFTITEQKVLTRLYFYLRSNDNDNATATFSKIQLESGSTAHEWEKYTRWNTCTKPKLPFSY